MRLPPAIGCGCGNESLWRLLTARNRGRAAELVKPSFNDNCEESPEIVETSSCIELATEQIYTANYVPTVAYICD